MKKPKMHRVKSSQLKAIGYADLMLYVDFKAGGRYRYENVPLAILKILLDANDIIKHCKGMERFGYEGPHPSIGSLFHYLVKIHPTLYPFKKVS